MTALETTQGLINCFSYPEVTGNVQYKGKSLYGSNTFPHIAGTQPVYI